MYPAVIIPDGNAIMAIPTSEEIMLTKRPISDIGYISPYPTVVNGQVDQYNASKKIQTKDFPCEKRRIFTAVFYFSIY